MSEAVLGSSDNSSDESAAALEASLRVLEERLQIQSELLAVSASIIRSSGSSMALEDAFRAVINICQTALHNDTSVISLYDKASHELVGVAKDNGPYKPDGYFRIPLSESSLSGLAFKAGRTISIDDVVNDPRVNQHVRQHFEAKSGIAAPLIIEGSVIGVLLSMTNTRQRSFTPRDIVLMEGLAGQAALALHTQMLRKGQIDAELRFQRLVELSPVPILLLERDGRIIEINRAAVRLLKPAREHHHGMTLREYIDPACADEIMAALEQARLETPVNVVITTPCIEGRVVTLEIDANLFTISGEPVVQVFMKDVSETREMVTRMSYLASHDPLTGLINRREFESRLRQAIASASKGHTEHALCYIDLDKFKIVNDSCGHYAGDELLREITALLKGRVRDRDSLARLGGDEFALLLQNCPQEKALEIANGILQTLAEFRFYWQEKIFTIGASIGVTPIDSGSGTLEQLLQDADSACYIAKEQGRNRVHAARHNDSLLSLHNEELELFQEITQALKEGRLRLCHQRSMALAESRQDEWHCEILARLVSGSGQLIGPERFIPVAEKYNLMAQIDRTVISHVFTVLKGQAAPSRPSMCAINISGQSLLQQEFIPFVAALAQQNGVTPGMVCFELREITALSNLTLARRFINELKEAGFRFALDNFGDSPSSFAYINTLPLDYIKLDRSLISKVTSDPIHRTLVEAINKISHLVGIETIAEFVEDGATLDALRHIGVDFVQGYHISKPAPLDAFSLANK